MNTATSPNTEDATLTKLLKDLTDRETELLRRLTADPTNEEVADAMCVSPKSIANYKNRIGEKLGLKGNRTILKFVLKNCAFFQSISSIFINPAQGAEKQETGNRKQETEKQKNRETGDFAT